MEEFCEESFIVDATPQDLKIIRDFYGNQSLDEAQQYFETELENALECNCKTIVIEPKNFGDATARWIYIGNVLEKSSVLTGLTSIVSAIFWPNKTIIYCPFAAISFLCTSLYSISWASDKCSNYRVIFFDERKVDEDKELKKLRECLCCENTPVILCKEENSSSQYKKNLFHRSITFIATVLSAYRFYDLVTKLSKFS